MVTANKSDFVSVVCDTLNIANSRNNGSNVAFYSYRGPDSSKFPNLKAADTNNDGQLDFVIGITSDDFSKFQKSNSDVFAPGKQKMQSLWGNPVMVSPDEIESRCRVPQQSDDKSKDIIMGAVPFAGLGVAAFGTMGVIATGTALSLGGLLVVGGLAITVLGVVLQANASEAKFEKAVPAIYHSLETLIQSQ